MTDVMIPTPLGFTSTLLDTLSSTRTQLDMFVSHHKSQLGGLVQSGGADRAQMESAIAEFTNRLDAVEGENGAVRLANVAKRDELAQKEAEIEGLEEKVRKEGGEHIKNLQKEESTAQNLASSASSARASSESSKSSTMNLLTKSIVSYREGLSLDFERAAGNRLRLVFTNVDPSDVDRIFAFTINVNESEEYEVEEIMPKVDVEELVEAVNSDNDFGGFVRGVRNAFKSTC
ncbi:hypothetical protein TL16_g07949 [Triparma laevis f. inornata]|uniref:Kinetochore protein SPC25 n=2 Tax=Triparma laevis TaxID=1534972 RepID=A0A9W7FLN5_9STRA|nr:hypothetical protein TL16_g07949 [Triparma laevis f. inornata]GMI14281.1 hypothetical protein TrLO_g4799 [Triparma laevis f. longispina]